MDSIRKFVKKPMHRIANWLNDITGGKITPNFVTLTSLVLHLPIFWAIVAQQFTLAAVMLVVFGLLDSLDGELARLQGRASRAGMLLDASADRMKEAIVFAALAYMFALDSEPTAVLVTVAAITGAYTVSYIKAKGETALKGSRLGVQEINRIFQSGLMRYEVRTAFLVVGLIFSSLLLPVIWAIALLSWLTAFYRLISISKKISKGSA